MVWMSFFEIDGEVFLVIVHHQIELYRVISFFLEVYFEKAYFVNRLPLVDASGNHIPMVDVKCCMGPSGLVIGTHHENSNGFIQLKVKKTVKKSFFFFIFKAF